MTAVFVTLGGDICHWTSAGRQAAALRHPPPLEADALLIALEPASGVLASSGDRERCVVIDGRCCGQVLDRPPAPPAPGTQAFSARRAPRCPPAAATPRSRRR